jgi:hypothetical protein
MPLNQEHPMHAMSEFGSLALPSAGRYHGKARPLLRQRVEAFEIPA